MEHHDLQAAREAIGKIDRELMELLRRRLGLVEDIAAGREAPAAGAGPGVAVDIRRRSAIVPPMRNSFLIALLGSLLCLAGVPRAVSSHSCDHEHDSAPAPDCMGCVVHATPSHPPAAVSGPQPLAFTSPVAAPAVEVLPSGVVPDIPEARGPPVLS